ncbi:MAG: nitronate monooxygenase [Solirubrobacteraceae bacterium]
MSHERAAPRLIQGGMGVAVSDWRLARTVAQMGEMGVVSGTAIGTVCARRLQDGDPHGDLRRALEAFPDQAVAGRIIDRYLLPGGRPAGRPYRAVPVPRQHPVRQFDEMTVAGAFVEVFLAKEGHDGNVGINFLEKIQMPTLPSLYGAILAGVDYVLMGAGIPIHIPGAIASLAEHRLTEIPLSVVGATAEDHFTLSFDPRSVVKDPGPALVAPRFIAIVSSHVLASHLARSEEARPWGFVVEAPIAGGHNAPPRGRLMLDAAGEPIYGPRDRVDMEQMRAIGLPFYLAGGYADPAKLRQALAEGASGVQIGSAFALCEESGLEPELKRRAREEVAAGRLRPYTDAVGSPTGFPFKVGRLEGTIADPDGKVHRSRRCDLGYLVTTYRREDGSVGYRCPSEPDEDFLRKGGRPEDLTGRICLCNGLVSSAGLAQYRLDEGGLEPMLLTLGDDVCRVLKVLSPDGAPYHAADVVRYVLGEGTAPA